MAGLRSAGPAKGRAPGRRGALSAPAAAARSGSCRRGDGGRGPSEGSITAGMDPQCLFQYSALPPLFQLCLSGYPFTFLHSYVLFKALTLLVAAGLFLN